MALYKKIQNSFLHLRQQISKTTQELPFHYWCDWPWSTLVVLCDGTVVCGCADPRAERPVGDLNRESLLDIWQGPRMEQIRSELQSGCLDFCLKCGLKQLNHGPITTRTFPATLSSPSRLFVEPSIRCNISCYKSHCNKTSGIEDTRRNQLLQPQLFESLMEQAGPSLQRLELFNYGEPFINKNLPDMITSVRKNYPHVFTFTSTNGLVWNNDQQLEKVIDSGLHELVFSIDGASPEVYERYRQGGDFSRAIHNMKRLIEIRNSKGATYPIVTYRYILFHWNDNDQEMENARHLAREVGVDRLCWELTDHPHGCPSQRFLPDTPEFDRIKNEIWDIGANANALRENVPTARIEPLIHDIVSAADELIEFRVIIRNTGNHLWLATAPDNLRFVTLGIQLCDEYKQPVIRDFHRELLGVNVHPQNEVTLTVRLRTPKRGCYWLKFDMVLEGYGWFESGGSPIKFIPLMVL